jgi:hypothetical protein
MLAQIFSKFLFISVEHTLYVCQSVYSKLHEAKECNLTVSNPVKYIFLYEFSNVYQLVSYNIVLSVAMEAGNVFAEL